MNIFKLMAAQLREPKGILGQLFMCFYLNNENSSIIRRTIEQIKIQPGDSILDIGFGGGLGIQLMGSLVKEGQVTGIDISQSMVNKAKKKFAKEIKLGHVRIEACSVLNIPFADGEFDKVTAVHTIYFWPDTNQALKEILRVLRPGGTFAVSIHSKEKMQNFSITRHGFTLFSQEEVRSLLESTGFIKTTVAQFDLQKKLDEIVIMGVKKI